MHQRFAWTMQSVPTMTAQDQAQIRAYLANPTGVPITGLVSRLVDNHPQAKDHLDGQPFDKMRQLLGPLLLWGLHQPWASECDIPACLNHWTEHLNSFSGKTNNTAAGQFLRLMPLLDEHEHELQLNTAQKLSLRADMYTMANRLMQWDNIVTVAPTSSTQTLLWPMTKLAVSCAKEKRNNETVAATWKKNVRTAMPGLSTYSEKEWLLAMMSNAVPAPFLKAAFVAASPLVWLMPEFKDAISNFLPADEEARQKQLKWASNRWSAPSHSQIRPGDVNRLLHKTYCPMLYIGLEMLLPKVDDWEDRAYVTIFATSLSAPKGTLPLPMDFDTPDEDVPRP